MMEKPLVSVVMITYGQEKYITQAINGVFIQKTNFPVELIIANDCSPDNSDIVIKETIKNAPENIRVNYIRHEKNIGMNPNFLFALKQAQGKYIAICEGDDYWIEPTKLQKQVDFLEQNPDYVICCHNINFIKGDEITTPNNFEKYFGERTIEDLSKENIIPTLSSVFRNLNLEFPKWFHSIPFGDYPLWLLHAKYGKIMFMKDIMGMYRQEVGVWSGKTKNYIGIIDFLNKIMDELEDFPSAINNLRNQKIRYIKLMLLKTSLKDILKNPFFKELNIQDKSIVLLKKLTNFSN